MAEKGIEMVITRSPLRITLGGGGTDLPSYYRQRGGFLVAGAVDKYVYVTAMRPFVPGIFLKYSKIEHVETIDEVQHPIIREALRLAGFRTPQIELTALADIPAGTGLGSSGSFTTALLRALFAHRRSLLHARELAEMACDIEINKLGEPIGKQDQYIAAYGGLTCFTFHPDGTVDAEPLRMPVEKMFNLEDHLLLFFTGFARSASTILADQQQRTTASDAAMLANLDAVKALGLESRAVLERGDTAGFGALMHEQWEQKKRRSGGMSNPTIDEWYELGRRNGAIGGKLVGAGGGGFLMFYAEDQARLRTAMTRAGLEEVRFRFDFEGTKVLFS
jgi:D-glycero-alpha-D-manno-heptose-7-phosphate kinase